MNWRHLGTIQPVSGKYRDPQLWGPRVPIFTWIWGPGSPYSHKYRDPGPYIFCEYRDPIIDLETPWIWHGNFMFSYGLNDVTANMSTKQGIHNSNNNSINKNGSKTVSFSATLTNPSVCDWRCYSSTLKYIYLIIGASLSEPHIDGTTARFRIWSWLHSWWKEIRATLHSWWKEIRAT